jgi:hypothetical protein
MAQKNYKQGKIYKIEPRIDCDEGDIYIGSTTKERLSQRMTAHRGDYSKWLKGKHTKLTSFDIFEKYGVKNCEIVLLESVEANNLDELLAREKHYIKTLKCVNRCCPLITVEEKKEQDRQYHWEHREEILIKKKNYREKNADVIKEKVHERYECPCGASVTVYHKSRHNKTKKHIEYCNKVIGEFV